MWHQWDLHKSHLTRMVFADWASSWHLIWRRCIVFFFNAAQLLWASRWRYRCLTRARKRLWMQELKRRSWYEPACVLVYCSDLHHCLSFSLKLAAFPTIIRSIGVVKAVSLWLRKLKETLLVKGWQYIRDMSFLMCHQNTSVLQTQGFRSTQKYLKLCLCVCVFSIGSDKWFLVLSLLLKAWVDEAADPRGCYLGSAGIGKVPAVSSSQTIEWGRAERAGVALLWVR